MQKAFVLALVVGVLAGVGCNLLTGPSADNSFTLKGVTPVAGTVFDFTDNDPKEIAISFSAVVKDSGVYYGVAWIRDDGVVLMNNAWGPSQGDVVMDFTLRQSTRNVHSDPVGKHFTAFGVRHTVNAAWVVLQTNPLALEGAGEVGIRNFPWDKALYRADIPLNYRFVWE